MKKFLLLIFCVFTFSSVYSGSFSEEYRKKYQTTLLQCILNAKSFTNDSDFTKKKRRRNIANERALKVILDRVKKDKQRIAKIKAEQEIDKYHFFPVSERFYNPIVYKNLDTIKYDYLYLTQNYYLDLYENFIYKNISPENKYIIQKITHKKDNINLNDLTILSQIRLKTDSLWFKSIEYQNYKQQREGVLPNEKKYLSVKKQRKELIDSIKQNTENFFNYWLFYVIYIIANLGVFQMKRYIRSGIRGSATPLIEISMIILNIAYIIALVIFGFKTVWYYPIILYALGWIVGELLYLILRKLFGEWNPLVWFVITLISTIILYIVLFSPSRDYSLPQDECYICTGQYSKAYHIRKKCKGLKHCGGDVIQIKIEDLSSKYKNNPCAYCNKDK